MKVYKLPINIFEKDLKAKTKNILVGTEFSFKRKFYFYLLGTILTMSLLLFQWNYDFISWEKPWHGNTITIKADGVSVLKDATPRDNDSHSEVFYAPEGSVLTVVKGEIWNSEDEEADAVFSIKDSTAGEKVLYENLFGIMRTGEYTIPISKPNKASSSRKMKKFTLNIRNDWGDNGSWRFWMGLVEFILSAIILIIIWWFIIPDMSREEWYSKKRRNEKLASKRLSNILLLKLDFKSQSKKDKDITGSIYVNSPDNNYLNDICTLAIQNKTFVTKETISKDADKINDIDNHFDLDRLKVEPDKQNILDDGFIRVLAGESEIDVYAGIIERMNSKYGIHVTRIEFVILPLWDCEVQNKQGQVKKLYLDTVWGKPIEFRNNK